jgi:hypothetical protein
MHGDPFLVITQKVQYLKVYKLYGVSAICMLLKLIVMLLDTGYDLSSELISLQVRMVEGGKSFSQRGKIDVVLCPMLYFLKLVL